MVFDRLFGCLMMIVMADNNYYQLLVNNSYLMVDNGYLVTA